jgi:hypothetical protein
MFTNCKTQIVKQSLKLGKRCHHPTHLGQADLALLLLGDEAWFRLDFGNSRFATLIHQVSLRDAEFRVSVLGM